jgi:hypothetical protein
MLQPKFLTNPIACRMACPSRLSQCTQAGWVSGNGLVSAFPAGISWFFSVLPTPSAQKHFHFVISHCNFGRYT